MGGGTSRFEETNWARADGGLGSPLETVDGAAPSEGYRKIHVVKRGLNQREFDVIDVASRNLLYTTRAVPGTLAWFDVLGPRSCGRFKDLLLRVQVDLSRRTWTVYKYHTPVFEGQKPATLPVRKGLDDHRVELFKAACVTVAWSRYVAIAARYGPPSEEHLEHLQKQYLRSMQQQSPPETQPQEQGDEANKEANEDPADSPTESKPPATAALTSITKPVDSTLGSEITPSKAQNLLTRATASCICSPKDRSPDTSLHNPSSFDGMAEAKSPLATTPNTTMLTDPKAAGSLKKYFSSRLLRSPFAAAVPSSGSAPSTDDDDQESTAAHTAAVAPTGGDCGLPNQLACPGPPGGNDAREEYEARKVLAMEGTIDLEGPLLECQEIYNKIIGNHQTALIGKEKVLRLWQLDEAQHHPEEPPPSSPTPTPASPSRQGTDDDPFVRAVHEEALSPRHAPSPAKGFVPSAPPTRPPEPAANTSNWFSRLQSSVAPLVANTNHTPQKLPAPRPENPPTTAIEATSLAITNTKSPWFGFGTTSGSGTNDDVQEISFEQEEEAVGPDPSAKEEVTEQPEYQEDLKPNGSSSTSTTLASVSSTTPSSSASSAASLLDLVAQEDAASASGGKVLFPPLSPARCLSPQEKEQLPNLMDEDDHDEEEDSDDSERSGEDRADSLVVVPDKEGTPSVGIRVVEPEEESPADEPLIGYWSWKNTYTVHKVELHLAQNSDVALHVVLAILCNQVRYERNALAMTV